MLQLIRFYTQEEAIEKYQMPPDIAAEVFSMVRSFAGSSGQPVYAEPEIDAAINGYLRPNGRIGRRTTTHKHGEFAAKKKKQGHSWSETAKAVNEKYGTNYNETSMRRCVDRVNDRQLTSKTEEKN
jgi:hypothetical protein